MQFYDGGAFADCPYIQYPHGMGKQRPPPAVVAAAATAAMSAGTLPKAAASSSSYSSPFRAYPFPTRAPNAAMPAISATNETSSSGTAVLAIPSTAVTTCVVAAAPTSSTPRQTETAEETTARTAKGIQDSLNAAQHKTEVFDGRRLALQTRERAAVNKPNAASKSLTIVVSSSEGVAGARESDPSPIVRSPTKEKKNVFTDALLLRSSSSNSSTKKDGSETGAAISASSNTIMVADGGGDVRSVAAANNNKSRKVVVPFCVSSWHNRKKLIVPVEQRLAQQHDDRLDNESGMGDAIVDLAMAMQQASKEVAAELAAKEKAKAEEEERRQAALEAAEAEKARRLLEQKAAELAANAQRHETREQRLERIRLERELREQEKLAKQEQRLRERAAARLNITVADLEADEQLLKTVEEASAHVGTVPAAVSALSAYSGASKGGDASAFNQRNTSGGNVRLELSAQTANLATEVGDDDDEGTTGGRRKPAVRGGVFASAVISNEGIQREMEALEAVETQQQQENGATSHDGIRLHEENENSADEDDDGEGEDFQLHNFVKKRRRL